MKPKKTKNEKSFAKWSIMDWKVKGNGDGVLNIMDSGGESVGVSK